MLSTLAAIAMIAISQPVQEDPIDGDRQIAAQWVKDHSISYLRVELETPGGPLPFILQAPSKGKMIAGASGFESLILNGDEKIKCFMNTVGGGDAGLAEANIQFPAYGSLLEATGTGDCTRPSIAPRHFLRNGAWTKSRGKSDAVVIFQAEPVNSPSDRFEVHEYTGEPAAFTGRWSVDFESSKDLAVGTFTVDMNQLASGTFLTTTGDYRFLAGRVDGNLMRLSTFDGAHAFLFHARMQEDGTIEGDFYSGNWWHETWTAVRDENATLPDAFEETTIADEAALEEMVFKDLEGVPTRVLDLLDESNANARIIEIFGTWCPNCSDAGRELVSLREQYGDDLAVVGLAFEITEDFDRSVTQVKRHHEHIGTDWPILVAGLSDKAKASVALPVLDKVRSYPTLIFLNQDNEVQAVYTGFSGPATGEVYKKQRLRFEALIEDAIAE
jgi:thiol-disulfide isomerase/thioredoxin